VSWQPWLPALLHRIWQEKGPLSNLLQPLSLLVRYWVKNKEARYTRHRQPDAPPGVPVIVVGNIMVGGTGKTPVVIALVHALRQAGWTPGVISRGYGTRIGKHPRVFNPANPGELSHHVGEIPATLAHYIGDEPALIVNSTDAPIAVHPQRLLAAQALRQACPHIDIVISDDGLQHLALARDIEIVVQDERGIGNGRLLPAGPLREPATRLAHVDVLITNNQQAPPQQPPSGPLHVQMNLLPYAVEHVASGRIIRWEQWLDSTASQRAKTTVMAMAAIGNPQRFFLMLRQAGIALDQTLTLADHSRYHPQLFANLTADVILMTAKDAVKCRAFNDPRLWAVLVEPHFEPKDWITQLPLKPVH